MLRGTAEWSWKSKGIGIEHLGSSLPMFLKRLIGQPLKGRLRFAEEGIPAAVSG